MFFKSTQTLTFGDQAENHAGMQKIGELSEKGFGKEFLDNAKRLFEERGCACELINLNKALEGVDLDGHEVEDAWVLIMRNGVNALLGEDGDAGDLYLEQNELNHDTMAKMRGRVVNKRARYNLCFAEEGQEPEYENGKGRIVPWDDVELTKKLWERLGEVLGDETSGLQLEGNYYYDISQCGIGFHGDGERRKVVAARLGATIPLHYQWFYQTLPVGERVKLMINHGDMYIMGEKAVGFDWKRRSIFSLRHAAGCKKFLTIKKK